MGKGKRRHHNVPAQSSSKKQKQTQSKDDEDGSTVVLVRSKKLSSSGPIHPVPGLMNLGNTCFFNSVMQNLAQTHILRQKLQTLLSTEESKVVLPSHRHKLPPLSLTVTSKPGKFAEDFHCFLKDMHSKPRQPLNPRIVFNHVCKNASRFISYQQQDSQELLRYLLDALRNEEIHRIKRAILDLYNVKGKASERMTLSDVEKKDIKAYGMQAMQSATFVDDVFGGKITSTVTCLDCQTRYEIQEDFLDLSLSVPSDGTKGGFPSKSSLKGKKRSTHRSSEDVEGDDEGEELRVHKNKARDETPRLSKHQIKQKRKEERKRSRTKPQRYSLDQFNKNPPFNQQDDITIDNIRELSPIKHSSSNPTMEHHDSCLADDEVTLLSTQQDSDSSALFMHQNSLDDDHRDSNGFHYDNVGDVVYPRSENAIDDDNAIVDCVTDKIEGMSLSNNQNISDSVVAMFEASHDIEPQPSDTPLHSPHIISTEKTKTNHVTREGCSTKDDNNDANDDDEIKLKFGISSREVSLTLVTSSLQNIDEETEVVTSATVEIGKEDSVNNITSNQPVTVNSNNTKDKEDDCIIDKQLKNDSTLKTEQCSVSSKQVDKFSLDYCLQQFTMTELLTGSDRFFCESCTSERQKSKQKCPAEAKSINSDVTQQNIDTVSDTIVNQQTVCTGDSSAAKCTTPDQPDSTLTTEEHEKDISIERSASSSSSCTSYKEEDEDTEMLESTKESDDNMDDNFSHDSSIDGEAGAVFRDATKQMLIGSCPNVLCLHMKRFIQQGRNFKSMRKNSCFISFPLILDVAPYSTEKCKESNSIRGQILYSLYGIVVHKGEMHGGHYTALVRVRNEQDKVEKTSHATSAPSILLADDTPNILSESVNPNIIQNKDGSNRIVDTTHSNKDGAEAVTTSDFDFDLTLTDGVWYHISDTHVRKVTEPEVLASEAYLLFYERLPIVKIC